METSKSSRSTILIVAIWALTLWLASYTAPRPTAEVVFPANPSFAAVTLLLPWFFVVIALTRRASPLQFHRLSQMINGRFGPNTFESFLVRLRPMLLFATAAFLVGSVGLWRTYQSRGTLSVYEPDLFFLSVGLAMAVAHFVFYFRKAVGYYPTWTLEGHGPVSVETARGDETNRTLTARRAFLTYWWTWIGLAVLPLVAFVGGELFHLRFDFFTLPFFGLFFLAYWPAASGRAPRWSYMFLVMGTWFAGGVIASLVTALIHFIQRRT
jgi:hypothetical protein